MAYKILLMGASYGSLLASKILFGGHSVHLVCLPAEAERVQRARAARREQVHGVAVSLRLEKLPHRADLQELRRLGHFQPSFFVHRSLL